MLRKNRWLMYRKIFDSVAWLTLALAVSAGHVFAEDAWTLDFADENQRRPANFYRLEKALEPELCKAVLEKLNEAGPLAGEGSDFYNQLFVNNSASVKWTRLTKPEYADSIEYFAYDLKKDPPNWTPNLEHIYRYWVSLGIDIPAISWIPDHLSEDEINDFQAKKILLKYSNPIGIAYREIGVIEKNYPNLRWDNGIFTHYLGKNLLTIPPDNLLMTSINIKAKDFCNKPYHVLISKVTHCETKTICHIVSNSIVKCKYQK